METTMSAIEKNGGKIIRPKTKIEAEGRGYFALFIDSERNREGIFGQIVARLQMKVIDGQQLTNFCPLLFFAKCISKSILLAKNIKIIC